MIRSLLPWVLLAGLATYAWVKIQHLNTELALARAAARPPSTRFVATPSPAPAAAAPVPASETTPAPAAGAPLAAAYEDAMLKWIDKAQRLAGFLDQHPEWRVPQLDVLTAEDWLEAVKGIALDSEASYRQALAALRLKARQRVAPMVADALKQAMAANGGHLPTDPQALAPYLPDAYRATLPAYLQLNSGGQVPGLRAIGSGPTRQFGLADKLVDPVWDSSLYYSDGGDVVVTSAASSTAKRISDAFAKFTQQNGTPPSSPAQLRSYPSIDQVSDAVLADAFIALSRRP
ncbi:hypothetical protein [Opitutus sp. ER46]|uniref:hypothetical protein n=1 Tax=Opitutus sp. ER46 TaxID=2161864 RepID=UPI000D2F6720|nr:hypothetical protein [Opitutus sp. ER46]PTX95621.1 hypothetical protein DB354_09395 [Opitutus sp. ER46]